ncbi:MAG: hypothetical protein H5T76_00665, partial [Streptomyces sp.]|nr:hypothetical protein [Streptomyces sp.]
MTEAETATGARTEAPAGNGAAPRTAYAPEGGANAGAAAPPLPRRTADPTGGSAPAGRSALESGSAPVGGYAAESGSAPGGGSASPSGSAPGAGAGSDDAPGPLPRRVPRHDPAPADDAAFIPKARNGEADADPGAGGARPLRRRVRGATLRTTSVSEAERQA